MFRAYVVWYHGADGVLDCFEREDGLRFRFPLVMNYPTGFATGEKGARVSALMGEDT